MSAPTTLRVGSTWLDSVAAWGDLEITHGRNGSQAASWTMALRPGQRPPAMVRNAWVGIYDGPRLTWSGTLSSPDWDGLAFEAVGIARAGEGAECLTSGGAITSKPNTAIDAAINRGVVPWSRGADFGNTDMAGPEGGTGVSDPEPGKLNELLDQVAVESGQQWRVSAAGLLTRYTESEASPSWLVQPGVAEMGEADDDVTDRVFVRYFSSTASAYRTASYPATTPTGGIERRASVTHLGPMDATRATAIAQGIYTRMQSGRTGWTNGFEVGRQQITDLGGNPADLSLIRPGQTVRLLGMRDPRGASHSTDVVIGETVRSPAERTIQINPVGLVAATWEQVLEQANAKGDS